MVDKGICADAKMVELYEAQLLDVVLETKVKFLTQFDIHVYLSWFGILVPLL